ncbi:hypothetical protein HPB47_018085 [Ixodes persulcatus]|uniref:Uncharacterized protein n=1 Tax=Ixodes persulcatus TaxID=34615 RepID=A0AC60QLN7_IXOPE|nr:hypothetical protein HPB47_018085 [Ixodes persulcatus]
MLTYVTLIETGKWLKSAEVAPLADRFDEGERCKKMVRAIIDSGGEISVVRDEVAPEMKGSSGRVTLTGAFGDSVVRSQKMAVALSFSFYKHDRPEDKPRALQVVLVAVNKDRLKIQATTFDGVGGRDFDMVLVRYFVQEFMKCYNWTWPPTGAPSCASSPSARGSRSR